MKAFTPTEAQFQEAVIQYAQLKGWKVAHFRAAKTERGWRTAVQADGAGFPDLVMVRGERIVFAELKSERGVPSAQQVDWLVALGYCPVESYIWKPRHWPLIEKTLA